MKMKIEIRSDSAILEGYVSAVDRDSRPIPSPQGKFIERIKPKTFEKSLLRHRNVELRFNHERVLGSVESGELMELYEDNIGLRAKARVSDKDILKKARNNELRGWSFGFYANKDSWEDAEGGMQRRILEDIELIEVSILDKTPAYIATTIEARDAGEVIVETRSAEEKAEAAKDMTVYKKQAEILRMRGKAYENF